jgi:hypothetical protein
MTETERTTKEQVLEILRSLQQIEEFTDYAHTVEEILHWLDLNLPRKSEKYNCLVLPTEQKTGVILRAAHNQRFWEIAAYKENYLRGKKNKVVCVVGAGSAGACSVFCSELPFDLSPEVVAELEKVFLGGRKSVTRSSRDRASDPAKPE